MDKRNGKLLPNQLTFTERQQVRHLHAINSFDGTASMAVGHVAEEPTLAIGRGQNSRNLPPTAPRDMGNIDAVTEALATKLDQCYDQQPCGECAAYRECRSWWDIVVARGPSLADMPRHLTAIGRLRELKGVGA